MDAGSEVLLGPGDISIKRPARSFKIILSYTILILGAICFLLPLFYMIGTSLKTQAEVYVFPPTILPENFLWQNYNHDNFITFIGQS